MNKVLIALLTGIAVGILAAPRKGSDTRKKLFDDFNDLANEFSRTASEVYDAEKDMIHETMSEVRDAAHNI